MPGMDGYEVLQQIVSDPALRDVPVIMVSSFDESASVVMCVEAGAADYLHKPIDTALLRARIGNCLEKKRLYEAEIQLRQGLAQKYEQLQKLERLRDDLTHLIVHDLRTPVNSIVGGLNMLAGSDLEFGPIGSG